MIQRLVLGIILVLIVSSCRFGKPLLAIPHKTEIVKDSAGGTTVTKYWTFICFRTGIHLGCYTKTKQYDSKNRLQYFTKMKTTHCSCCDQPAKYFTEKIHYDTLGQVWSINYLGERQGGRARTVFYRYEIKNEL